MWFMVENEALGLKIYVLGLKIYVLELNIQVLELKNEKCLGFRG